MYVCRYLGTCTLWSINRSLVWPPKRKSLVRPCFGGLPMMALISISSSLCLPYYAPPYGRDIKRFCDPTVCMSVCPSACLCCFLILSNSLYGDMRASPLQTHLIGDSTVGYARIQMLTCFPRSPCTIYATLRPGRLDVRGRRRWLRTR